MTEPPIPTPRKDAAGQRIDQHRETCDQCSTGDGCRVGRALYQLYLRAWDQDLDTAGLIHDHTNPAKPCRACNRPEPTP